MKSYSNLIIDLFEEQFHKYLLWFLCAIRTNRVDFSNRADKTTQQQHWKISVVNPLLISLIASRYALSRSLIYQNTKQQK